MLLTFRPRSGFTRCLAVFILLVASAPLLSPHAGGDDELCAALDGGPGGAPVMRTVVADQQPHHCLICHSLRSFRTPLTDCGPAAVRVVSEQAVADAMSAWRRAPALDRLPARAPPA